MKGYGLFMLAALLLSGCSTSKDEMLPPGDGTMLDLWQKKPAAPGPRQRPGVCYAGG